jgi:hypothetical protein
MKLRITVWVFGCLLLARSGAAESFVLITNNPNGASNPYAIISDRNVFHLNPIPPEPVPEPPKVELPVIKLSGFFKQGRQTKALFSSQPKDKKDGTIYYNLSEGEKSGFLELVKIHYDQGEAEIVNSGTRMTLSFKDDSLGGKQETASNNQSPDPAQPPQPPYSPFHSFRRQ